MPAKPPHCPPFRTASVASPSARRTPHVRTKGQSRDRPCVPRKAEESRHSRMAKGVPRERARHPEQTSRCFDSLTAPSLRWGTCPKSPEKRLRLVAFRAADGRRDGQSRIPRQTPCVPWKAEECRHSRMAEGGPRERGRHPKHTSCCFDSLASPRLPCQPESNLGIDILGAVGRITRFLDGARRA